QSLVLYGIRKRNGTFLRVCAYRHFCLAHHTMAPKANLAKNAFPWFGGRAYCAYTAHKYIGAAVFCTLPARRPSKFNGTGKILPATMAANFVDDSRFLGGLAATAHVLENAHR